MARKLGQQAYAILVGVFIFGAVLTLVNFVVAELPANQQGEVHTDSYGLNNSASLPQTPWDSIWNFISGGLSPILNSPIFQFFSLDLQILHNLGMLGVLIRMIYIAIITIGIVDLIWIG